MVKEFSQSVIENIGSYVYCLIDPIKKEIFYIGKGVGNRVFAHLGDAIKYPNSSDKLEQIREIRKNGKEPLHYIIRHNLTDVEAQKLEGALIDFARLNEVNSFNLTNLVRGVKSHENGIKTVEDIYHQYGATEIVIEERALVIVINKLFWFGIPPNDLYEATRKSWVGSKRRLENVQFVIATYFGIVREVYEVEEWFDIFDDRTQKIRYGFEGKVAANEIRNKYLHQSAIRYKGNGNPLKYVNC